MTEEKKTFSTEVDKILHLMVHSLYTNRACLEIPLTIGGLEFVVIFNNNN